MKMQETLWKFDPVASHDTHKPNCRATLQIWSNARVNELSCYATAFWLSVALRDASPDQFYLFQALDFKFHPHFFSSNPSPTSPSPPFSLSTTIFYQFHHFKPLTINPNFDFTHFFHHLTISPSPSSIDGSKQEHEGFASKLQFFFLISLYKSILRFPIVVEIVV
ncbi:hypothetical protein E3N88_38247 [Mikania micrantha]|uniref:Uncharacterized protein n=1 Tax=Mikania micrantha TaxID=192012 RepID=A0A5N6LTQ8_9ASTR|nr:hypothetical protein E3N88_38247 [Mikania micrantha]